MHTYIHFYSSCSWSRPVDKINNCCLHIHIYIRYTYYIRTYVHTYIHTYIHSTVFTIYILHSYIQFKKLENETAKSSVKRLVDDSDRCSTHIQGNIENRLATYYIHTYKHTYCTCIYIHTYIVNTYKTNSVTIVSPYRYIHDQQNLIAIYFQFACTLHRYSMYCLYINLRVLVSEKYIHTYRGIYMIGPLDLHTCTSE